MGLTANREIWTVGHSNFSFDQFSDLLNNHRIVYVVDVRSKPSSKYVPHFNRAVIKTKLKEIGIGYLYLGASLGGKPDSPDFYDSDGYVNYQQIADTAEFQGSLDRIIAGAESHRLALMCSCGKPDDCHRRLLIGKALCEKDVRLHHILGDNRVRTESTVFSHPDSLFDPPWRSAMRVARFK